MEMSGRNTEKVEHAEKPQERKEARDGDLARDDWGQLGGQPGRPDVFVGQGHANSGAPQEMNS